MELTLGNIALKGLLCFSKLWKREFFRAGWKKYNEGVRGFYFALLFLCSLFFERKKKCKFSWTTVVHGAASLNKRIVFLRVSLFYNKKGFFPGTGKATRSSPYNER